MVGISGRSRGCRTCKRRRKGCDLTRPKCLRCIKAGFVCYGYEEDDGRTGENDLSSRPPRHVRPTGAHHQAICLPSTLHVTAAQSACFQAAWCDMHAFDATLVKAAKTHAWIFDFTQIHTRGTALNYGFAAVALARVGEQKRNPSLLRQAAVAYTLALARTKNRLTDPALALTDESLGCTMLLALYEAMHGPSDDRIAIMRTHLDAAQRLIMHRGPAASGSDVSLLMLKDMLRTGIWESLVSRKRHFLASDKWIHQIWRHNAPTADDRMILAIAALPDAFEKLDWFSQLSLSQRTAYGVMDVYASFQEIISRLSDARREAGITDGGFVYVPSSLLQIGRDDEAIELVPQVRRYSTLTEARIELDQAVAQLVLHLDLARLHRVAQDSGLIEKMLSLAQDQWPGERATVRTALWHMEHAFSEGQRYCDTIVETVEQLLLPNVGIAASTSTTIHFVVASGLLAATHDPRLKYLQTIAHHFDTSTGLPFVHLLRLAGSVV